MASGIPPPPPAGVGAPRVGGAGSVGPAGVVGAPGASARPAALGAGALLAAGAMASTHAFSWAFTILAARLLAPAAYGELASLIALTVAGSTPGLALQAVVARHVALRERAGQPLSGLRPALLRSVWLLSAGLAAVALAAVPAVTAFLHLGSAVPALWLVANLAPIPALLAVQGIVQGRERFGQLTLLLLASGALKLLFGIGLVLAGLGVSGALAGTAFATLAALLLGIALAVPRSGSGAPGARSVPTPGPVPVPVPVAGRVREPGPGAKPEAEASIGGELGAATVSLLGLTLLANLDLLLARHFLPAAESGLYAAGSVLVKIAFWAPQSLVTVAFPSMATGRGRLEGKVAAAVVALTAALAAGSALVLIWPALLPFGAAYAAVGADLPRFALLGGCLGLVQLACFSGIATADGRMHRLVAAAVVAETALVAALFHDSVTGIVTTALVVAVALLIAGRVARR